jgi:hypothetical protein
MQADVERLMARLLTDPVLRKRFVSDPAVVTREAGLSAEEAEAISGLAVEDLLTAARSYDFKRSSYRNEAWRRRLLNWFGRY